MASEVAQVLLTLGKVFSSSSTLASFCTLYVTSVHIHLVGFVAWVFWLCWLVYNLNVTAL